MVKSVKPWKILVYIWQLSAYNFHLFYMMIYLTKRSYNSCQHRWHHLIIYYTPLRGEIRKPTILLCKIFESLLIKISNHDSVYHVKVLL